MSQDDVYLNASRVTFGTLEDGLELGTDDDVKCLDISLDNCARSKRGDFEGDQGGECYEGIGAQMNRVYQRAKTCNG